MRTNIGEVEMTESTDHTGLVMLTADVVGSYVSNNSVAAADLPALIQSIYSTLSSVGAAPVAPVEELKPAVSVKKSVTPDYIVCLEDGKQFKSLKRHLRTAYDMTPEEYRTKWGLPNDYPMVAPSYAQARSALAKKMGLGQQRSAAKKTEAPAPAKRGRKAAAA
jgi:predicted transcriptional regulator